MMHPITTSISHDKKCALNERIVIESAQASSENSIHNSVAAMKHVVKKLLDSVWVMTIRQ